MNDLISRQAAIEQAEKKSQVEGAYGYMDTKSIVDMLEDLPAAEPERKKGKWIKMSDADGIYYCCSECGEELYRRWSFDRDYDLFPKKETIERTNFCPNCGSYNGGE